MSLVLNEYRRRSEGDDKATDLYRFTADAKSLFALSCQAGLINVEKYNPIFNRWELFRNITVKDLFTKRESFGMVFVNDLIVLIGGIDNGTCAQKVNCHSSPLVCY